MPDSPTKIAFCITELDPGGAERALVELVTRLDRERFTPRVFCLSDRGELAADLEQHHIPTTFLDVKYRADIRVVFRLAKALKEFQPEILQTWLFHANLAGRFAGRLAKVPHIFSGIRVAEKRGRLRLWADRFSQKIVERHICVSEDVAKFSIERGGLPPDRVSVIPNGVDAARFANACPVDVTDFGIPTDAKIVLFVGRLDPQKDPLWLLDVFPKIQELASDVHLVYLGQGPLESELKFAIAQHPSQKNLHVLGWRSDVASWLKRADVVAFPSRWEGMPNVVLEAAAAGTPIISTAVEGVSEILTPGQTGWLVRERDFVSWVSAFREVFQDAETATRIAQSAQSIVKDKFTWDETCRKYVEFYESALLDSPKKPNAEPPKK